MAADLPVDDSGDGARAAREAWRATITPTIAPADCTHPEHSVFCGMAAMLDSGKWMAEIEIRCARCGEAFRFVGLPAGLSFEQPSTSIDGLQLLAPVEPEGERRLMAGARYVLPQIPPRH